MASGDDTAMQHLSWPKMVRANDGALILAYSAGIGHNKGASGLAWSVSRDGGLSFSPPALLCYFPRDDARYHDVGNMAMGIGAEGAVILLAMAYQGEVASTVLGWRSADCGRSWQRCDTSALAENRTGSVFGHIFAVPGRGLAVSGHFRSPHTPGIWLAYSMDDGHSWGPPQTVTTELFFEPVFVHAGGRLIGLVRENKACAYHQFVSDDGGMTWQMVWEETHAWNVAVSPDYDNDQTLWATLMSNSPMLGTAFILSHDGGETWQAAGQEAVHRRAFLRACTPRPIIKHAAAKVNRRQAALGRRSSAGRHRLRPRGPLLTLSALMSRNWPRPVRNS